MHPACHTAGRYTAPTPTVPSLPVVCHYHLHTHNEYPRGPQAGFSLPLFPAMLCGWFDTTTAGLFAGRCRTPDRRAGGRTGLPTPALPYRPHHALPSRAHAARGFPTPNSRAALPACTRTQHPPPALPDCMLLLPLRAHTCTLPPAGCLTWRTFQTSALALARLGLVPFRLHSGLQLVPFYPVSLGTSHFRHALYALLCHSPSSPLSCVCDVLPAPAFRARTSSAGATPMGHSLLQVLAPKVVASHAGGILLPRTHASQPGTTGTTAHHALTPPPYTAHYPFTGRKRT